MVFEVPEVDYTRYSNRQLATIPLAVLAAALLVLSGSFLLTGTPVGLGTDFTGGTELTVETTSSQAEIRDAFESQPTSIQRVQLSENRYILTFQTTSDASDDQSERLRQQAEQNLEPVDGDVVVSTQQTSPAFSGSNQFFAQVGLVIAFIGMSVLAFLLFRSFVPSIAIVISAFSDIVVPLAVMSLLGIQLSLGTVAALLMLIGYSVDSDILLNNHILRRSGDFYESTHRAMQTGVTMTLTSMSAMFVMAVVSFLFGIELLSSIGLVLVLGLAVDLMNTYMLNLSLLRWYKIGEVSP